MSRATRFVVLFCGFQCQAFVMAIIVARGTGLVVMALLLACILGILPSAALAIAGCRNRLLHAYISGTWIVAFALVACWLFSSRNPLVLAAVVICAAPLVRLVLPVPDQGDGIISCRKCGYPRSGVEGARCPECGLHYGQ